MTLGVDRPEGRLLSTDLVSNDEVAEYARYLECV